MIRIHDKIHVDQPKTAFILDAKGSDPISIERVTITEGGLLNQEVSPTPGGVELTDVGNARIPHGKYFVMLWPPDDMKKQIATPFLKWINNDPNLRVYASPYEAAFRGKCDHAFIHGVHFVGYDKPDAPDKQVVQIRHGKRWTFDRCTFEKSWPDIGQQKVSINGKPGVYVKSQQVGTVIFTECTFLQWNGSLVYSRQPGVKKIVFENCIDPNGRKFNKTKTF